MIVFESLNYMVNSFGISNVYNVGPRFVSVQLVNTTPISFWFMVHITIVNGVINQLTTRGAHMEWFTGSISGWAPGMAMERDIGYISMLNACYPLSIEQFAVEGGPLSLLIFT